MAFTYTINGTERHQATRRQNLWVNLQGKFKCFWNYKNKIYLIYVHAFNAEISMHLP